MPSSRTASDERSIDRFQAVLIDLDGVVRRWDDHPVDEVERAHGMKPGEISQTAFAPDLLDLVLVGRISDEEWRQTTTQHLARRHGLAVARAAIEAWSAPVGTVDADVLTIVRTLRRRLRVALITNATTRLERDLRALGLTDEFDAVVNSARVHARKPSAAIYHSALSMLKVRATEALFVDDSQENVESALPLGITAHVFTSPADLRMFLLRYGLVDAPGEQMS